MSRKTGLVTTQQQHTIDVQIHLHRPEPGLNGSCKSLFPILIHENNGILELNRTTNCSVVSSEHDQDWHCTGFFRNAKSASEKCFVLEHEQLLGLAQAAARSGGKYDGSN